MSWRENSYPIKELATGETLSLKTFTIDQGNPGPHIHIQASVHGAELQGNAVILQLMDRLNSLKILGSITFIPLANPYATNNKHGTYTYGRYNPVTGNNWNRNYSDILIETEYDIAAFALSVKDFSWTEIKKLFKEELKNIFIVYENKLNKNKSLSENNKLNLLLQKLASSADTILDLHTGPVATRYLYAAEYEKQASFHLNFKHILIVPNEFGGAMDEAAFMPWIHLRKQLSLLGKEIMLDIESFTLEFGSEETFSMNSASKDVESILNFLKYKNVLKGETKRIESFSCELEDFKTIFAPVGGLVDYHFEPGENFEAGNILASFYNFKNLDPANPIESARTQVIADKDGVVINRCPSSSVHQGMELFQIMTNLNKYKGD